MKPNKVSILFYWLIVDTKDRYFSFFHYIAFLSFPRDFKQRPNFPSLPFQISIKGGRDVKYVRLMEILSLLCQGLNDPFTSIYSIVKTTPFRFYLHI